MNKKAFSLIICVLIAGMAAACGCTGTTAVPGDSGLVIVTEDFPPFNYQDEDGRVTGLSTDIVNEVLKRLDQKAGIRLLEWSEAYKTAAGDPDTAIYSIVRSPERESLFKWAGPIASYEAVLYARTGSGITIGSLEAAKKVNAIAVVRDDARHNILLENNFENIILCDDDTGCVGKLMSGEADLWFGSSANCGYFIDEAGYGRAEVTGVYPVRTNVLYIAFNPAVPDETVSQWQNAIDSIKADGTFDSIHEEYGMSPSVIASDSGQQTGLFAIEAYTDGRISSVLRGLQVAAVTAAAASGEWTEIKSVLAVLEEKEPDARMWYSQTDGTYYTVVDGLASANLADRSYFPDLLAGRESVGTVVISHSTGRSVAVAAVPVMDGDKVTGIVGASIYLEGITEDLKEELPGYVFYAIDKEGTFALNSDTGLISQEVLLMDKSTPFGQAVEYMTGGNEGTVQYQLEGKTWNAAFRKSPLTGWTFVVAASDGD